VSGEVPARHPEVYSQDPESQAQPLAASTPVPTITYTGTSGNIPLASIVTSAEPIPSHTSTLSYYQFYQNYLWDTLAWAAADSSEYLGRGVLAIPVWRTDECNSSFENFIGYDAFGKSVCKDPGTRTTQDGGEDGGGDSAAGKLHLSKTVDKGVAESGDTITYTLEIKNPTDLNLFNQTITDLIPPELAASSIKVSAKSGAINVDTAKSPALVTWKIPEINSGDRFTATISAVIKPRIYGEFTNWTSIGNVQACHFSLTNAPRIGTNPGGDSLVAAKINGEKQDQAACGAVTRVATPCAKGGHVIGYGEDGTPLCESTFINSTLNLSQTGTPLNPLLAIFLVLLLAVICARGSLRFRRAPFERSQNVV
jgi:uncharacterized repeat protein (TIGR01451 family)